MSSSPASDLAVRIPTIADVEAAAKRIAGQAVLTPLLESPALNQRIGGRLLVKAEPLQRTGSFKFRGAYNRMSQLNEDQRKRGVVAYSSGNHAQGVACAAKMLGMPAVIVMPADAPAIKVRNTKSYGAEVVLYDRYTQDREAVGGQIAKERSAVIVPPYDDPDIIAGQGTCGLEIAEQARAMGTKLDAVIANSGGGGLIAGIALAITAKSPGTAVYAAEPAGFEDHARSLKSGKRETNDPAARSICDALLAATPGEITFAINSRLLKGGLTVTDDEARAAMAAAFMELKIVVEPGGACGLAAVLTGKLPTQGKTIAVVCSGGNVEPETFISAIKTA
jgi:threonine dehydratase